MTAHFTQMRKIILAAALLLVVAACSNPNSVSFRSTVPIPEPLRAEMAAKDMPRTSPILVRVYKKESELELWKQTSSGRFALLKSYPICRWSGQLGPKKTEGDRQVPEGFYQVSQSQLNPNSNYYLSFDVGYPNNFDRQLGRAGGNIMVHGSCSSRGCFAMTDNQMAEIYAVAREALQAGQPAFQLQSFPFRMTAENMARNRRNPNIGFWQNLKQGSDNFEVTKQAVKVDTCKGQYVFNGDGGGACGLSPASPTIAAAVYDKKRDDEAKIASLIASGTKAVNYIYEDGGSNKVFVARAVDQTAIPGKDRPFAYSGVEATEVALNDSGAPATEADANAAKRITYSAAEDLLLSEAAVARRQVKGPLSPDVVGVRQQAVYARLMGSKFPVAPAPTPVVVAKMSPADAAPVQVASVGSDQPFYARWLGLGGDDQQAKPVITAQAAPIQTTGSLPSSSKTKGGKPKAAHSGANLGKPVVASAAPAPDQLASLPTAPARTPAEQPFYKRWLGFADENTGAN